MINNSCFPEEILKIAERIKKDEGELFLVGGSVRDVLMGIVPEEFDFEIYGNSARRRKHLLLTEEEKKDDCNFFVLKMKKLLEEFGPVNEAGKSYGIMKIKSRPYDFSFPRKEKKSGSTRKDYEIILDPFVGFKEAQQRRDLTINSLMYSFEEEKIIDNFNGLNDLKNKIIRIVDPVTFPEDPLRVYRIAQFISRLGFVPDNETIALCKKMDIGELSVERIQWEIDKRLKGQYIRDGREFLFETEVFQKRHPDFYFLLEENWQKTEVLNNINKYTENDMNMVERFLFIFVLFEEILPEKLGKIEEIYNSFSRNKKDINRALDSWKALGVLTDFVFEKITFEKGIMLLMEIKDINPIRYFEFWQDIHCLDKLKERISEAKRMMGISLATVPLVTGDDLLKIGIKPTDSFKEILRECLSMQIQGLGKNEIIEKIKRRENL